MKNFLFPHSDGFEIAASVKDISNKAWNELTGDNNPFLEHEFLKALETSGSVGRNSGWIPRYLILKEKDRLKGSLPLYLKYNSYGEYIFDWSWASAYQRAGLAYYPKYVIGIPYTPATGKRILVHPEADYAETAGKLIARLLDSAEKDRVSSIHFLFCEQEEMSLLAEKGFSPRYTHQFHWKNNDYKSFEHFLEQFNSKKRNQIKRERRQAAEGIEIELLENENITHEHLQIFYNFYINTINRKWAHDYLKKKFFSDIYEMRQYIVMVMAKKDDRYIAGTLNFRKNDHLYGRYWGCTEDKQCLHFELCYYRLIEYAINNKITLFEAGAQGEHKLIRGLLPNYTYSAHWFAHPAFSEAIANYLVQEKEMADSNMEYYKKASPFKPVKIE